MFFIYFAKLEVTGMRCIYLKFSIRRFQESWRWVTSVFRTERPILKFTGRTVMILCALESHCLLTTYLSYFWACVFDRLILQASMLLQRSTSFFQVKRKSRR